MESVNKKNVILVVLFALILLVIFLLVSKFTYSYLEPDISDDVAQKGLVRSETDINGNTLVFRDGVALEMAGSIANFGVGGNNGKSLTNSTVPSVSYVTRDNIEVTEQYNVGFKITENDFKYSTALQKGELLLTIEDLSSPNEDKIIRNNVDGLTFKTVTDRFGDTYSGYDITEVPVGAYNVVYNKTITTASSTTERWKFTLTFVNYEDRQDVNEEATIRLKAILQKEKIEMELSDYCDDVTLAQCIIDEVYNNHDGNGFVYLHDNDNTAVDELAYTAKTLEAGDDSYRYSGPNYLVTSNSRTYSTLNKKFAASAYGLIGKYCDTVEQFPEYSGECINPTYYLDYDSTTRYNTYQDVYTAAVQDGLLELKNYVCFGYDPGNDSICRDASANKDYLYRIIGLFKDTQNNYQLKLIKYDYADSTLIGGNRVGTYSSDTYSAGSYAAYKALGLSSTINRYYWSTNTSVSENETSYSNIWADSNLNTGNLNEYYLNSLDTVSSKWKNVIELRNWVSGGNTWAKIGTTTTKNIYNNEIVSPIASIDTEFPDTQKVSLMYISDYLYAASPDHWAKYGYNDTQSRDYRSAINYNWLYMGVSEWTMTRNDQYLYTATLITNNGNVNSNYAQSRTFAVRPTFYLDSNIELKRGTGSIENPFILNLDNVSEE